MSEKPVAPLEDLTFKQASDELERVIRSLESNQLELEASLSTYERGVALVGMLKKQLTAAEQKVETLMGEIEPESSDEVDTTLS